MILGKCLIFKESAKVPKVLNFGTLEVWRSEVWFGFASLRFVAHSAALSLVQESLSPPERELSELSKIIL